MRFRGERNAMPETTLRVGRYDGCHCDGLNCYQSLGSFYIPRYPSFQNKTVTSAISARHEMGVVHDTKGDLGGSERRGHVERQNRIIVCQSAVSTVPAVPTALHRCMSFPKLSYSKTRAAVRVVYKTARMTSG